MNNDDRPLRQEDYLALAEELRQVKTENEKLKAPIKMNKPCSWAKFRSGSIIGISILLCSLVVLKLNKSSKLKQSPRTTLCYFTSHDYQHMEPWDFWYIFKSNYEGHYDGVALMDDKQLKFDTSIQALNFLNTWNASVCEENTP